MESKRKKMEKVVKEIRRILPGFTVTVMYTEVTDRLSVRLCYPLPSGGITCEEELFTQASEGIHLGRLINLARVMIEEVKEDYEQYFFEYAFEE